MFLVVIAALCSAWVSEHRKMKRYEVVYLREEQKQIMAAKQSGETKLRFDALMNNLAIEQRKKATSGVQSEEKSIADDSR